MEILKQGQYRPYPVEEQVITFYMVTVGLLDDIAVDDVKKFEEGLFEYIRRNKQDLIKEIGEKKQLDDDLKKKMDETIKEFKNSFK